MNSSVEEYFNEIRNICPQYDGPRRGRAQCSLLSKLSKKNRERFIFLENKIKLEKNRVAAKNARDRKRSMLENLIEENKNMKSLVDELFQENYKLKKQVESLKEIKHITVFKKIEKDEINNIKKDLKFHDLGKFNFLDNELDEPITFDI